MAARRLTRRLMLGAAAAATLALPASAQVSARDRQQAAQQHQQLLAQFGGAYQGPQQAYVERVGERIASAAGVRGQCTFTLINSDVVNAFAVPGCYVYVTRGLMAIVNSEAELASVMGHEIGHVIAKHSERRQNRSVLSGLGAIILGAVTKSDALGQIAAQGAQLYTLSFSRNQEFEADELGTRYLINAGYAPEASADVFEALARNEELTARTRGRDQKQSTPAWASTHPLTSDRIQRASTRARNSGVPPRSLPENEQAYLDAVSGLLFGDDPSQGYIVGASFSHPQLRIAFDAPPGFALTNSTQAVLIEGPNNMKAQFANARMQSRSLEDHANQLLRQLVGQARAEVGRAQYTRINGIDAVILPARVQSQQGALDVSVAAYQTDRDTAYHFIAIAPPGYGGRFDPLFRSFRQISDRDVSQLRPRRIEVVTARAGDTVASMASRMAVDDRPAEWFAALNGLSNNAALRPGQRVKIVAYGR